MTSSFDHQFFNSPQRVSQPLCNDRCQNILYKAVFEHFIDIKDIAPLLLTSKSFQNSSFGANFIINFIVDDNSIRLIESILSPSSCFSMQFVPSLHIKRSWVNAGNIHRGISDFVEELAQTKYLRSSLRSLALEDVNVEVLSFFIGRSGNVWPQLQNLTLANCGVNDTALEIISKHAVRLRTVDFSYNGNITDEGLEHLSLLTGVTSLDLCNCIYITDPGLEHISKLSGITSLDLYNCDWITDVGLEHLSKLPCIASLNLSCCRKITDAGVRHLSTLTLITFLDLASCINISDAGLEHVSQLSSITSVSFLNCSKITDVGLKHLSKLSRITSLNFYNCRGISDAGLESLSKLSCVTSLNLYGCRMITDAGLDHLYKLPNITSLNLRGCDKISRDAKTNLNSALRNCNIIG